MTDASIVDGDTCGVRHKNVPKLVNVELYMKKVSGVQEKVFEGDIRVIFVQSAFIILATVFMLNELAATWHLL